MKYWVLLMIEAIAGLLLLNSPTQGGAVKWKHLSSVHGDLPVPNAGKEQTASLVCDIDKDGHLDIWVAEMRLNDGNPKAKNMLLLGDGRGHFQTQIISEGIENHESKIADLDGDGDDDILDKIYNCQTPRLDIWLNEGPP